MRLEHVDAAEVGWEGGGDGPAVRSRLAIRAAYGEGVILSGDGRPFHDAAIRPASPDEVEAWLAEGAGGRARLPIGELRLAPGVPFALDAGGFDRHTFFCGQSGSGKTYSLGVVLEQLLLETSLRIVILDPNSDFARLDQVRPGVEEETAQRWRALADGIHIRSGAGDSRLCLRMRELSREAQAAALRLDPVADREEHAELDTIIDDARPESVEELLGGARPQFERAGAAHPQPRHRPLGRVGARQRRVGDDPARRRRGALPRARPRVARQPRGAGARGHCGARDAVGAAGRAAAGADRDRRGPQRLPQRPARRADRGRDRVRGADRRRGPQVRPLHARLHAATPEGAGEHRQPVRQPRADADGLGGRPRLHRRPAVLRAARPARRRDRVQARRGAGGRQARLPPGAAEVRPPRGRGGRRRRRGGLGVAAARSAGARGRGRPRRGGW